MADGDNTNTNMDNNATVNNPTGASSNNNNTNTNATSGGNTDGNGNTSTAPDGQSLSLDSVINFLKTDKKARHEVFYNHYQSELDSQKGQHLETWKRNNLPGIVQEEINKYVEKNFPQESIEQKRLREVESKMAERDREIQRERLINKGMGYANATNLVIGDKINWFVGDSEEETRARIDWLQEFKESAKREGRNEVIAQHSRTPQSGSDNSGVTMDNFRQRYDEAKRKWGMNALANDPELRDFFNKNAGKIKL